MAWWEGVVDETRVLIAPDQGPAKNSSGNLISLRHPKSGNKTTYLFMNGILQELHWFKQSYGSWFLGDYVCEDGSLYTSTPVDPVFIMLPIFEEARMKKGDDLGKFRQVDEMIFIDGYPGYQQMSSILEKSMHVVCEVKEIGSTKFFRLDDSKVLAWLCQKVERLRDTLLTLDKNYDAQDEKQTLVSVVSIMGEYLKEEPWLNLLCSHFGLTLQDIAGNKNDPGALHMDNAVGSSSQEKSQMEKRIAKTGKQAKKVKVETDSRNIRDMLSRACKKAAKAT
ncbi:hypothetical protein V2J09_003923 [Rumex salicifolius]